MGLFSRSKPANPADGQTAKPARSITTRRSTNKSLGPANTVSGLAGGFMSSGSLYYYDESRASEIRAYEQKGDSIPQNCIMNGDYARRYMQALQQKGYRSLSDAKVRESRTGGTDIVGLGRFNIKTYKNKPFIWH